MYLINDATRNAVLVHPITDRELLRDEAGRGKTIVSDVTQRRWELVRELRECIYGSVLLAIEFRELPEGRRQYATQHAAIKIMFWDRIQVREL